MVGSFEPPPPFSIFGEMVFEKICGKYQKIFNPKLFKANLYTHLTTVYYFSANFMMR